MVPPRYHFIILCLFCVFVVRISCAITNKVDGRSPRFNRTTVRHVNTGGNSIQTIHASNRNNHIAGITNGKSVGIGGILGAKESKAIGDSLRQGLRKVLPFGNSIQHKSRVGTTVNNAARKNNLITRQTKGKQHGNTMTTGRIRTGVGNTGNKVSNGQRKIVGRPSSVTRGRPNKMVSIKSGSHGQSKSGNGGHSNTKSGDTQHLSRNMQMHSKMASANNVGHGKSTNHGSTTGTVRNSKNTVHSKFRKTQVQTQAPRGVPSNSRAMPSNSRSASQRTSNVRTMSSSGSSNGRSVSMSNNNNHRHGNAGTSNGNTRSNMGRNSGQFHTNNGAIHHSRNSGFNNGQNIMQRTSQRTAMGHSSFPVSSGMQSNIRRRNGGIPRGISNSGKRVVVQNGRRIIVSPSRFSMRRQRFQTSQQRQRQQQAQTQQIRIVGDALEGGLENLDIDNIIGLASKIASVKLANSVLSSVGGQEGTPQLSRFLINSELDIVPEVIMTAPRQIIQAPRQAPRRVVQAPRRIITIKQRAPNAVQSQSSQTATNELQVAPSGYGTPVLVRSGGEIQFSRVDQNGKQISSVKISKGKQTNTIDNANTVKSNSKSTTGTATETGNGNGNGGTSKQAPEKELEMEMEHEGLSTTTAAATQPTKPLLPPTTTVANSVILT